MIRWLPRYRCRHSHAHFRPDWYRHRYHTGEHCWQWSSRLFLANSVAQRMCLRTNTRSYQAYWHMLPHSCIHSLSRQNQHTRLHPHHRKYPVHKSTVKICWFIAYNFEFLPGESKIFFSNQENQSLKNIAFQKIHLAILKGCR